MRANNVREFLRMLDPKDASYGIKRLSATDKDQLKKAICSSASKLPRGYSEAISGFKKTATSQAMPYIADFFIKNPGFYAEYLIKSEVLYLPLKLKGLTLKQILEQLKPVSISKYILKCSDSNRYYAHATGMLRQKLGMSKSGRFDKDTGRKLYTKIKGRLPKKRGYLASEVNPDLLFSSHFEEYVVYVDANIWGACSLDVKYYAKDTNIVWKVKEIRDIIKKKSGRNSADARINDELLQFIIECMAGHQSFEPSNSSMLLENAANTFRINKMINLDKGKDRQPVRNIDSNFIKSVTTTYTGWDAWRKIVSIAFDIGLNAATIGLIISAISGTTAITGPGGIAVATAEAGKFVDSAVRISYGFTLLISAICYTMNDGGFNFTVNTLNNSNKLIDTLINLPSVERIK